MEGAVQSNWVEVSFSKNYPGSDTDITIMNQIVKDHKHCSMKSELDNNYVNVGNLLDVYESITIQCLVQCCFYQHTDLLEHTSKRWFRRVHFVSKSSLTIGDDDKRCHAVTQSRYRKNQKQCLHTRYCSTILDSEDDTEEAALSFGSF